MVIRKLAICSFALSALLAFVTFASGPDAGAPAVKKSKNGICHDVQSPDYQRTKNFIAFDSMPECLESGGRYPKRTPTAETHSSDSYGPLLPLVQSGTNKLRKAVFWVEEHPTIALAIALFGIFLYREVLHYIRRRRVRMRDRRRAERERDQWSGHRREIPNDSGKREHEHVSVRRQEVSDDNLFKHRRHRQDPWLKVLGYFKKKNL